MPRSMPLRNVGVGHEVASCGSRSFPVSEGMSMGIVHYAGEEGCAIVDVVNDLQGWP